MTIPREVCSRESTEVPEPGLVVCETHDQCAQEEFCGLGFCRDGAEPVLACLEEAAVTGDVTGLGEPPDLWAAWAGFYADRLETPVVEDKCAPVWHTCATWPASSLGSSVLALLWRDPANHIVSGFAGDTSLTFAEARGFVNAGCTNVRLESYGFGRPVTTEVVVSVHYPAR